MKSITVTQITKVTTSNLIKKDLIQAFVASGIIPPTIYSRNVDIYVKIPGGGDWSNTNLQIDDKNVELIVSYQTVDTETKAE